MSWESHTLSNRLVVAKVDLEKLAAELNPLLKFYDPLGTFVLEVCCGEECGSAISRSACEGRIYGVEAMIINFISL